MSPSYARLLSLIFAGTMFCLAFPGAASATPIVCTNVAGNLIANCGFETGDLSGWTQGGNTSFTNAANSLNVITSGDTYNPASGNWQAQLGPTGSDGTLSQSFATTPGSTYQVTFFMAGEGGAGSDFSAVFDGNTLFSTVNPAQQFYTMYTYSVSATAASGTLEFVFRNDTSFQLLDDVSVASTSAPAIPEPGTDFLLILGLAGSAAIARHRRGNSQYYR